MKGLIILGLIILIAFIATSSSNTQFIEEYQPVCDKFAPSWATNIFADNLSPVPFVQIGGCTYSNDYHKNDVLWQRESYYVVERNGEYILGKEWGWN